MRPGYEVQNLSGRFFYQERFHGNPAGVVSNVDGLTEVQMQQIARELITTLKLHSFFHQMTAGTM